MTDNTLVLTFPKKNIMSENDQFIQIDTTMTREQFLFALMKSIDEPIAVVKRD